MLYFSSIHENLLELVKVLMQIDVFNKLRLVGGTSLALQIGHRKSIDIDLFGKIDTDEINIIDLLLPLGEVVQIKKSKNISIFLVNNLKLDVVNYPYPWIDSLIEVDNIRLAGIKDIAAMKLNAITGRGTKKDFVDLFFLLQKFSIEEIFMFYNLKYKHPPEMLALKSLLYFDDAENDEMPDMLMPVSWKEAKTFIKKIVEEYIR